MSKNDELYGEAMDAITALFSDTSVSRKETKEALDSLIAGIEMMIETLEQSN